MMAKIKKAQEISKVADILPGFYPSVYTAAAVRFLSVQANG